jgi:hypothetical protein
MIAFSSDCSWLSQKYNLWENTYELFISFENSNIRALQMQPSQCSFNAGVFVANITMWRKSDVTRQLEHWMELNTRCALVPVRLCCMSANLSGLLPAER